MGLRVKELLKNHLFTSVGAVLGVLAVLLWAIVGTFSVQDGYRVAVIAFTLLITILIVFVLQTQFKIYDLDREKSSYDLLPQTTLFISYILTISFGTSEFVNNQQNHLQTLFVLGIIYLTGFYATYSALRANEKCIAKLESR